MGYRQTQTGERQLQIPTRFFAIQQIHDDQRAAGDQRMPAVMCKRDTVEPIGGACADGQDLPTFNARCHLGDHLTDHRLRMRFCRRPQSGERRLAEALKPMTCFGLFELIGVAQLFNPLFNPFVDRRRPVGDQHRRRRNSRNRGKDQQVFNNV